MSDFFVLLDLEVDGIVNADNTCVYASGPVYKDFLQKLQNILRNTATWGNCWNLQFNASESAIIRMLIKWFKPDDTIYIPELILTRPSASRFQTICPVTRT